MCRCARSRGRTKSRRCEARSGRCELLGKARSLAAKTAILNQNRPRSPQDRIGGLAELRLDLADAAVVAMPCWSRVPVAAGSALVVHHRERGCAGSRGSNAEMPRSPPPTPVRDLEASQTSTCGRHRYRTNIVPSRSTRAPRPSGRIRVNSLKPAPSPGILAKIPCGPRVIRPLATS
jgi:hypothetical protein